MEDKRDAVTAEAIAHRLATLETAAGSIAASVAILADTLLRRRSLNLLSRRSVYIGAGSEQVLAGGPDAEALWVYVQEGQISNLTFQQAGASMPASSVGDWVVIPLWSVGGTVTVQASAPVSLLFGGVTLEQARLLAEMMAPGGSTVSPVYASLTGGSIPAGSATIGAVNEQRYNGSAWEDVYNNTQNNLLATASRTTTTSSPIQTIRNGGAILVTLYISAVPASPSTGSGLTVDIVGEDGQGNAFNLQSTSSLITSVGTYGFVVAKAGGSTTAQINEATRNPVPRQWFARVNAPTTDAYTYALNVSVS